MPLGPLVRVPVFVAICVWVFCLAFIAADADAAQTTLGPDVSSTGEHCARDTASSSPSDNIALVRLEQWKLCQTLSGYLSILGGWRTQTPMNATATGRSLADLWSKLDTVVNQLDTNASNPGGVLDEIRTFDSQTVNRLDSVTSQLDTIHGDLVDVVAALDAQGTDSQPLRVRYATAETQPEQAANAQLGALWFLCGLLVVVVVAGAIRKAVMPS